MIRHTRHCEHGCLFTNHRYKECIDNSVSLQYQVNHWHPFTETYKLSYILFGHGRKCLNILLNRITFTKLIAFSMQSYFPNKISAVRFSIGKGYIIHHNASCNCIYKSVCYLKRAQYSWSWKQTNKGLKEGTGGFGSVSTVRWMTCSEMYHHGDQNQDNWPLKDFQRG